MALNSSTKSPIVYATSNNHTNLPPEVTYLNISEFFQPYLAPELIFNGATSVLIIDLPDNIAKTRCQRLKEQGLRTKLVRTPGEVTRREMKEFEAIVIDGWAHPEHIQQVLDLLAAQ